VFVIQATTADLQRLIDDYALHPARWSANPKSLVTCMFLHGGIVHLLGNMLFLWIAGHNVEARLGHLPHGVFYLVAGVAGSFAHIFMTSGAGAEIPTVGASGAISGVMGALLVFFPANKIRFLILPFMKTVTSPAWYVIPLWAATQVGLAQMQMQGKPTNVAVFAHLGGFLFGFAAALLLRLFSYGQKKGGEG
jgi:membrane associated rhomboid family serine protease